MKFQPFTLLCVLVGCGGASTQGSVLEPSDDSDSDDDASNGGGTGGDPGSVVQGSTRADAGSAMMGREGGHDARPQPVPDDASPEDASPDLPVGMFVAIGHGGRRIASCDDGKTWVADQFVNQSDEDHALWSAKGIAYGQGSFVSAFGWGTPTAFLLKSIDGVAWQQTFGLEQKGPNAGDVAFGKGVFAVTAGRSMAYVSADLGATWKIKTYGKEDAPILRRLVYSAGNFVAVGDSNRVVYSPDLGDTWLANAAASTTCAGRLSLAAAGGGTILTIGKGGACRSRDGGVSWQAFASPLVPGEVIWTGSDFFAAGVREGYRTQDGEVWTTVPQSIEPNTWVRILGASKQGTLVGVDERGDKFFRSTDGRRWTRSVGPSGTNIVEITYGETRTSTVCGLP